MRKRFVAGLLLSCCACQAYTPIALEPDATGRIVRVTLTPVGSAASFGKLGTGVGQLEGRLGGIDDSTLTMSVSQVSRLGSDADRWTGENVTIPRSSVASIEMRHLAVGRSLLAAGAVVGGTILVGQSIGSGSQTGGARGGSQSGQK